MTEFLQTLMDALSFGSIYALVALGIGLLFGILRLLNMAHGDFITIGAYSLIVPAHDISARVFIGDWNWFAVIVVVIMIVVLVAMISDLLVFRHLRRSSAPTLMIASFGVSYFIENALLIIYGGQPKGIDFWHQLDSQQVIGGIRVPTLHLVTLLVTVVLMIALTLFLKKTAMGKQMRAAAEDFKMAQYLGVRANLVIVAAFAISGALAAVVALLFLPQSGSLNYMMGTPLALFAYVAVVVGGMGSLVGAVAGGYFLGLVVTLLQAYLPPDLRAFRDAFAFGLVILVLLVRPDGLFPSRQLRKRV